MLHTMLSLFLNSTDKVPRLYFSGLSFVWPFSILPHCWTDNKLILPYTESSQKAQSSTQTTKPLSVL